MFIERLLSSLRQKPPTGAKWYSWISQLDFFLAITKGPQYRLFVFTKKEKRKKTCSDPRTTGIEVSKTPGAMVGNARAQSNLTQSKYTIVNLS